MLVIFIKVLQATTKRYREVQDTAERVEFTRWNLVLA